MNLIQSKTIKNNHSCNQLTTKINVNIVVKNLIIIITNGDMKKIVNKKLEIEKIKLENNNIKEKQELVKLKIKLQNCKKLDKTTFKSLNKMLMNHSNINSYNGNTTNIQNNNIQLYGFCKDVLNYLTNIKNKKQ